MPSLEFIQDMLRCLILTIILETTVLVVVLSRRHTILVKLFAGVWLSGCTYPVVWMVFPQMFSERWLYLLVSETFAPIAECVLFWWAFVRWLPANQWSLLRDLAAIILANLFSFLVGELLN